MKFLAINALNFQLQVDVDVDVDVPTWMRCRNPYPTDQS